MRLPSARRAAEEDLKVAQQGRLRQTVVRQPEGGADQPQQVVRLHLRGDELRGDHLLPVQLAEQVAREHGLAGADVAGDDDEPLSLLQPVAQVGHRALVELAC